MCRWRNYFFPDSIALKNPISFSVWSITDEWFSRFVAVQRYDFVRRWISLRHRSTLVNNRHIWARAKRRTVRICVGHVQRHQYHHHYDDDSVDIAHSDIHLPSPYRQPDNYMSERVSSFLTAHQLNIQGAAKKMTQHQKCDNSVRIENFCAKFCVIV